MSRMHEVAAVVGTVARGRLGRYSAGDDSLTDRLERELARQVGVPHALAVNSGTSALVCALVACGVGPGDDVLVPAYTWISDAAAAVAVGARPVLVDVDESLTLDVEDVMRRCTPRTRAVIAVHMGNLVCDMDAVRAVARELGIVVVEDASQAIGVTYRGRQAGSTGDVGVFSFNQHKNLRAGEGGAVLTSDARLHQRALVYHDVGSYTRSRREGLSEPVFSGLNLRMPEMCSAVLRPQVARLDAQIARRRRRRSAVLAALHLDAGVRTSPHHDEPAAAGLTLLFDDADRAARFAGSAPGATRLIETGRHVYTNWEPVMSRRTYDGRVDPWPADAPPDDASTCRRTLEVLERTCSISLNPDVPLSLHRARAKRIAAALTASARA